MTPRSTLALVALALPAFVQAQVGHDPARSPYRDVNQDMRMALYAGWYNGASDPAGVLPKSGPLLGARWDMRVGGPADLTVRLAAARTERDVIDPVRIAGNRLVETRDVTLGFGDVGLTFNLTGAKSWRTIVPAGHVNLGLVSDFSGKDVGGFKHGTTFEFSYGASVRVVPPGKRYQFRADIGSYMYSVEYPNSYYVVGGDGTSVLDAGTPKAAWRNNLVVSAGLSYYLFR